MHPIHREMADSVGADVQTVYRREELPDYFNGSVLSDLLYSTSEIEPEYDVFVFEHACTLYTLPRLVGKIGNATVLFLHSTAKFGGAEVYPLPEWPLPLRVAGKTHQTLDAALLKRLIGRYVDGVITVSEYFARRCSKWYDGLITVARPFIRSPKLGELDDAAVAIESKRAVYLGTDRGYKGLDLLIDAWSAVRKSHPSAELYLYGDGHSSRYGRREGVSVMGYADTLTEAFTGAGVFVHPAKLDAHPIAPIEAMYAGLPAIVTGATGSKRAISQVSDDLIVSPRTADQLAETISCYFDLPRDAKERLSNASRTTAERYTEAIRKREFPSAVTAHL
jgi:glycosyltransferase involved in cell wall biosynthesis